jgi:hypothetical protein
MKGVLKAMLLAKLKAVVAVVMVAAALGAGGLAYRAAAGPGAASAAPPEGKPAGELEALRRKVELLQLNLDLVLEKVRAQEAELKTLRGQAAAARAAVDEKALSTTQAALLALKVAETDQVLDQMLIKQWIAAKEAKAGANAPLSPEVEAALRALLRAVENQAKQHPADRDKVLERVREWLRQTDAILRPKN